GVELAEPSAELGESLVAHPGEQLGGRAPAVLDAGYLPGVIADPLPELGERPPGRPPCPAHLPSEVPGGGARALAHRLTPSNVPGTEARSLGGYLDRDRPAGTRERALESDQTPLPGKGSVTDVCKCRQRW